MKTIEEVLLQRVVLIDNGECTFLGTPAEIIQELEGLVSEREKAARIDEWDFIHELQDAAIDKGRDEWSKMKSERITALDSSIAGHEKSGGE